jgi:hypothetical protein
MKLKLIKGEIKKMGRNSPVYEKWCREMALIRVANRLAKPIKEEMSLREIQELSMRTSAWKDVENELRTKPKGERRFR